MITLADEGTTTTIGHAQLPMMRFYVELPQGSEPSIQLVDDRWEHTTLTARGLPASIIPVQPPQEKTAHQRIETDFVIDLEYYQQDCFFPDQPVSISQTGEIRSRRFALVELSPVQYNPVTGEITLLKSCSLELSVERSDIEDTKALINRYATPTYEQSFEHLFVNYGELEQGLTLTDKDPVGYLIIVYDSFMDAIQPFADYKESIGYDVTVTKTSEIPGGNTVSTIEDYIEEAYTSWEIPPTYVLLVGDTNQVPTKTSGLQWGVSCTDLYYGTITPGDYFPDISIGRFPAATADQVANMVDKTVYYEMRAYSSTEWMNKAAFLASVDNYQISEGTHNYVIDNYLLPNGFVCDKLYQVSYGATTQDVRDSINAGRSIVVFSGHGAVTYWADGPHFDQGDVNGLTNADMYPFVCSHACVTGTFDYGECFGETWLRAAEKGAIGFWGGSASTYSVSYTHLTLPTN